MNDGSQWHRQGSLLAYSLFRISGWLPLPLTLLSPPIAAGNSSALSGNYAPPVLLEEVTLRDHTLRSTPSPLLTFPFLERGDGDSKTLRAGGGGDLNGLYFQ